MKKSLIICLALIPGLFLMQSCSKKKGCTDPISINYDADAEKDDGTCEYAGLGGNATIEASPKHHDSLIVGTPSHRDSCFVKFNATNFPGADPAIYDLVLVADTGESHVHIHNLKKGKYFIYMTGYDTNINERVFGGIAYTLSSSDGEVEIDVPVSED